MLKKIINEERQKIKKARAKSHRKKTKAPAGIKSNIKFLKESKKEQRKLVLKFKKLFRQRQKVKKNLIERL
tara:strand:- start:162 stop:374 length:213 start_codon:yes stop_codon:yes gene_type:complete